jgi:hypothetical protein
VLPEWTAFRQWADAELRGRRARVYNGAAGQLDALPDRAAADRQEMVERLRAALLGRSLNPDERMRIEGMSDDQVVDFAAELATQTADDGRDQIGEADRRSAPRRQRPKRSP